MRCDDLSIWTTTSARAGVNADTNMTIAAANISRLLNMNFMMTPCHLNFLSAHDVVWTYVL
jgi:hypothetical protein